MADYRNFIKETNLRTSVFSIQKFIRKGSQYVIVNSFNCQSFIYIVFKDPQKPKAIQLQIDSKINTKAPVSSIYYDCIKDIIYLGTLFGQILIIDKYTPDYDSSKSKIVKIGDFNLQNSVSCLKSEDNILYALNYHNKLVLIHKQGYKIQDYFDLEDSITCVSQQSSSSSRIAIKFSSFQVPMLISSFRNFIPTYKYFQKQSLRKKQSSQSSIILSKSSFNQQSLDQSQQIVFLENNDKYVVASNGLQIQIYNIVKSNGFEILQLNYKLKNEITISSVSILNNYIMVLDEKQLSLINLQNKERFNFVENNFTKSKLKHNLIFTISDQFLLLTMKQPPTIQTKDIPKDLYSGYWILYFKKHIH